MEKPATVPLKRLHQNGKTYEFLSEVFRDFCSETNSPGLIRCFLSKLQEIYGVGRFACFKVSLRGGRYSFNPANIGSNSSQHQTRFDQEFLLGLQELLCLAITKEEFTGSCMELSFRDERLQWVSLGHPKQDSWLCIWDAVNFKDQDQFDCLVQLLQNEAAWYRKLDQTQALLYLDELTGLFNYRYLDVALDSELRRASRYQNSFSLLFIDLDDFKKVNDRYGHLVGSGVLKQFAKVLKEELREVDTIIRYGGDEYVILLLGTNTHVGVVVAERIRKRVAASVFEIDQHRIKLTCSLGVACYPEHGRSKEKLLRLADETMYQSKRKGKNLVMVVSDKGGIGKSEAYAST
ncbi:MAG: GGDEF domain-containing protein [Oligoflexales bacterium]|nr:GGDEF domain-containing protein [Oligoflexales bacterium]